MQGRINTTFGTYQADLFESGLVAEIGTSAFAVWCAIKAHSNFNSGVSWPSIRRLMQLTGLASGTVQTAIANLQSAHLLRSTLKGKRRFYVARERLDVKLGDRTLCSVVIDYVPTSLQKRLQQIKGALEEGKTDSATFADVEIIPGRGFQWDANAKVLRAAIQVTEVPQAVSPVDPLSEALLSPLALRVKQIEQIAKQRRAQTAQKVGAVSIIDTS